MPEQRAHWPRLILLRQALVILMVGMAWPVPAAASAAAAAETPVAVTDGPPLRFSIWTASSPRTVTVSWASDVSSVGIALVRFAPSGTTVTVLDPAVGSYPDIRVDSWSCYLVVPLTAGGSLGYSDLLCRLATQTGLAPPASLGLARLNFEPLPRRFSVYTTQGNWVITSSAEATPTAFPFVGVVDYWPAITTNSCFTAASITSLGVGLTDTLCVVPLAGALR